MQHLAAERMVLDLLHQGQALGAASSLIGQVHQQIFRNGMVDQVLHLLGVDLEILRLGLAAVNDGGNAAGRAKFLGSSARGPAVRGNAFNGTDFMFLNLFRRRTSLTGAPALKFKQRSHRRIAMNSLDGFAQQSRHRQGGNLHPVYRRA